jgi:hypothetical protein
MHIRTSLTPIVALMLPLLVGAVGPGCGKDKPEGEAATEEGAKHQASSDKSESDASSGDNLADDATSEKAHEGDTAETKHRRPGRDKLSRRPPPVKPTETPASRPTGEPPAPVPTVDGMPAPELAGAPTPPPAVPGAPNPEAVAPPVPSAPPAPVPAQPLPEPARPTNEVAPEGGRDAETLLPLSVVLEQLGASKLTPAGAIPGIAVRPGYSSVLYTRPDMTKFGVSLQVWQDGSRNESEDRYRRMRLQYPNAEEVTAVSPAKAFFAQFRGVQSLTFVDAVTRTVVSVSCGEGLCSHEQLAKLAKAVRARF